MSVETEGTFQHGANRDVDNAAEVLTNTTTQFQHGLTITADNTNTGIIYVGASTGVTAGTDGTTDGAPIYPGTWRFFAVRDASKVYVIASAANQVCYWDGN